MKKKYKLQLRVLILLIILIIALICFKTFKKETKNNVKVVDSIDNYGYTLDQRDSKLMKDTYKKLKEILNEKEIDYDKYAEELAKLFVIDLFTINNKINKYDVGSLEYVYPDNVENFKTNVEDTIYKIVEDNTKGKRKQELPIVSSVSIEEETNGEYELSDVQNKSYIVKLKWTYEKDMGYDSNAIITLIEKDNKLYVVEYSKGEENE
mgnify:FL=1